MIDRILEQQAQTTVLHEFEAEIAHLLLLAHQYMPPADLDRVTAAMQLARETCQGVIGTRPIPPLEHALAVSTIVAQMHIDAIGVAAGLVFEAVDGGLLSLERVEQVLGTATARVIGSMLRLNILERKQQQVSPKVTQEEREREEAAANTPSENKRRRAREALRLQQAEMVRKMFVGMADDPRVVLLKLAYRLHTMRIMSVPFYEGDREERYGVALETREIYAPLAGRLGIASIESELEDLAFRILEPEKHAWIHSIVEEESKQWRSYVERVCALLRDEMATIGVKAEVSGRVKHLYSFYKKVQRSLEATGQLQDDLKDVQSAVELGQIHDLVAFRILVENTQDCYLALGHVHSLWKPKEGRIKDFIANPKPNGYSALHTTIFCLDDQLVEVQIRTHKMHETAEYGVAMHWHYKDVGDRASASARELLSWLRQLNEWQHELGASTANDRECVEAVRSDIVQEQIFVFTPKGEVKDLPLGSTPLDFAYRVHSNVGDSCSGARIITEIGERQVARMVPLDYQLKSGEIVDIVTSHSAHPTRDWLHFAHTTAARSKIRRYLKTHERDINMQIGRERLNRELKILLGSRGIEAVNEEAEHWLCDEYRVALFDDLLAAIGADDVRPHAVAVKLVEHWHEGKEKEREGKDDAQAAMLPTSAPTMKPTTSAQLQVAGVSGLLTKLANCCCPLPGDEIVGFISRGKGVVVHRADCQNMRRHQHSDHERLIPVNWGSMSQPRYIAPIVITARDRSGLLRDIATVVSDINVNMTAVGTRVSNNRELVMISLTLEIDSLEQLHRLFTRLERVKDVQHIERDLGKKPAA